jgi:hypothetical protein
VAINYATRDITAVAGQDYTAATGAVVFSPANWTAPAQFTVTILGDNAVEPDETFAVNITAANASWIDPAASGAVVTIKNDDQPTLVSFQVPSTLSVVEGNAGTTPVVIPVTFNGVSVRPPRRRRRRRRRR